MPRPGEGVRAVALVGFMGAGKTTVGRELARILGWRFVDLDDLIQAGEGESIEQIFQQHGEARFREIESQILREALRQTHSSPTILGLGGGAFVNEQNRRVLAEAQVPSIFLDGSPDELFERCADPEVIRPLRRDREQFRKLYQSRRADYSRADFAVTTSQKDVTSIAQEIISKVKLIPVSGVSE